MNIKIDNRENKKRIASCVQFFTGKKYSTKKENQVYVGENVVHVEQLVVGDYIFDDKVCFEYKTSSDFIKSVMNGRVFKQAKYIQQYPFCYVIIVGNIAKEIQSQNQWKYWNRKGRLKTFTVNQALGAIARLAKDGKVLQCDNQQQAFYLMQKVALKCLENDSAKAIDKPRFKLTDPIASFLSCIYINETSRLPMKQAILIREHCHLESLRDLLDVTYDDLIRIKGIGKKTAEAVLDAIGEK